MGSFCFRSAVSFSLSERPASLFRRRAAMIRSWREKRRPDGPLSSPHGVAMAELTQQHRHTTPARKVRFDCRPSPRFLRPRGGCRESGFLSREGWRLARWLSRFTNFGPSGLLHPIWRTIQCQSPSETDFLHSSESSVKGFKLHGGEYGRE